MIVPRRQVTAYFRAPISEIPVFGDGHRDFYGFPAHDGHGVKIGWHRILDAEIADPSGDAPRRVSAEDIEPLAAYLARLLPGAAGAPLVEADVCFYAMTADESPVIDHLDDRTIAAAGLSGHGYKFSCVLGAIVGELALGVEPSIDLSLFALDRAALRGLIPAGTTIRGMRSGTRTCCPCWSRRSRWRRPCRSRRPAAARRAQLGDRALAKRILPRVADFPTGWEINTDSTAAGQRLLLEARERALADRAGAGVAGLHQQRRAASGPVRASRSSPRPPARSAALRAASAASPIACYRATIEKVPWGVGCCR